MAAGVTDHLWSVADLVALWESKERIRKRAAQMKLEDSPKNLSNWRFMLFWLLWLLPIPGRPWWLFIIGGVVVGLLMVLVLRKKEENSK